MRKEQRRVIEEHVRKVLSEDLNQKKVTKTMVRMVAEKVFEAIPVVEKEREKQAA
jgi:hypothetical protein